MTRIAVTATLMEKLEALAAALADNGLHLQLYRPEDASQDPADCLLLEPEHKELLCSVARSCPAVAIAERGSIADAVQAVKAGAADYLTLPLPADDLTAAVERALAEWVPRTTNSDRRGGGFEIIGNSPGMIDLSHRIERASATDSPVLILGESGTGKELVARALHAMSGRRQTPLLTLNCASIPAALIEAELFGRAAGAGEPPKTGLLQTAEGGTVFLDEIGALPETCQARLLQVLEAGTLRATGSSERQASNVRLLTASYQPLEPLAEQGRFRKDLLYRLNGFPILIPPLRERGDDILTLAERFLARTSERLSRAPVAFSTQALMTLRAYHWPGNVRELENAVERAVILCKGEEILASELAIEVPTYHGSSNGGGPVDGLTDIAVTANRAIAASAAPPASQGQLEQSAADSVGNGKAVPGDDGTSLETYFLNFVLEHQDQLTETELAERLGISRKSLWERRQRLNIPRKRTRKRGPRRDRA